MSSGRNCPAAGQPLAGMVHHKMHGEKWSAIPTAPATDDIKRYLRPVSTAASLEFGFATPSYIICETVHLDVPWRQDVVNEGFVVEPKGRIVRPNIRPGLGIEIDEDVVKKYLVKK